MVVIVFIAGLTGHYVFVTILVGFVSTFGVLKKTKNEDTTNEDTTKEDTTKEDTTNKDKTKARKNSLDGDKVPTEETVKVFLENEMGMTSGTKENAEGARAEPSEAIKTEPGEVRENEETAIEEEPMADTTMESSETSTSVQVDLVESEVTKENKSQGGEPMAETKGGSSETSTTVQVESRELKETKEKDIESQESEPKADVKVESSETSKAVEDEETKEKDLESQERSEKKDGEEKNEDGKSKDEEECEKQAVKTNVKEDFLFTAAICSTWIPTVVGDQKQKIYLKAGMTCLIKKITF